MVKNKAMSDYTADVVNAELRSGDVLKGNFTLCLIKAVQNQFSESTPRPKSA